MTAIAPKLDEMTKVAAPSMLPTAGVTVMLLVAASPLPSLMVYVCPVTGEAGRLTTVAAPTVLLTTTSVSAVVTVTAPAAVTTRTVTMVDESAQVDAVYFDAPSDRKQAPENALLSATFVPPLIVSEPLRWTVSVLVEVMPPARSMTQTC